MKTDLWFLLFVFCWLLCDICKLSKSCVFKRIVLYSILEAVMSSVWFGVGDHETERRIFFFFCKKLPYHRWLSIHQTNLLNKVADTGANWFLPNIHRESDFCHHNMIQSRLPCAFPLWRSQVNIFIMLLKKRLHVLTWIGSCHKVFQNL